MDDAREDDAKRRRLELLVEEEDLALAVPIWIVDTEASAKESAAGRDGTGSGDLEDVRRCTWKTQSPRCCRPCV